MVTPTSREQKVAKGARCKERKRKVHVGNAMLQRVAWDSKKNGIAYWLKTGHPKIRKETKNDKSSISLKSK